eukprot:10692368-Karenia_brevis.AAC.1
MLTSTWLCVGPGTGPWGVWGGGGVAPASRSFAAMCEISLINLVDLAGSEKAGQTGASSTRG